MGNTFAVIRRGGSVANNYLTEVVRVAIYKRCDCCGSRLPSGTKCGCSSKRYKEEDKHSKDDIFKQFYQTDEWRKVREEAVAEYDGLDVYSLYMQSEIEYGTTVHHIIPLRDDFSKKIKLSNLIYLTDSNHQTIHKAMKNSKQGYDNMVKLLTDLRLRYKKEYHSCSK